MDSHKALSSSQVRHYIAQLLNITPRLKRYFPFSSINKWLSEIDDDERKELIEMLVAIATVESGLNPMARNATSSALGLWQILDGSSTLRKLHISRRELASNIYLQILDCLLLVGKWLSAIDKDAVQNCLPNILSRYISHPRLRLLPLAWRDRKSVV